MKPLAILAIVQIILLLTILIKLHKSDCCKNSKNNKSMVVYPKQDTCAKVGPNPNNLPCCNSTNDPTGTSWGRAFTGLNGAAYCLPTSSPDACMQGCSEACQGDAGCMTKCGCNLAWGKKA